MELSDYDLGWLVGLLEGEGCFFAQKTPSGSQPSIGLETTDEDVIKRACCLMGIESYHNRDRRSENRGGIRHTKIMYRCRIGGSRAAKLMQELRPHLGSRRQARIDELLRDYQPSDRGESGRKAWRTRRERYGQSGGATGRPRIQSG